MAWLQVAPNVENQSASSCPLRNACLQCMHLKTTRGSADFCAKDLMLRCGDAVVCVLGWLLDSAGTGSRRATWEPGCCAAHGGLPHNARGHPCVCECIAFTAQLFLSLKHYLFLSSA